MTIKERIPKEFYKLFHSKYMEYYQIILLRLYEESAQSYSLLGLTHEECKDIINEKITTFTMDWTKEQFEDEGELLTRSNMASIMLKRLEQWGWLKKDYDETLNQNVISFPDYSQIFIEVFKKIFSEDTSLERESILSIYSYLFTYNADKEKNNEILKSALQTSKILLQMLANMQEGIRGYFEALSNKNTFLGIQEVLVNEMNNTDSHKYAILTTQDSFYRYKEEVKELIDKNISDNEVRKLELIEKRLQLEKESIAWKRNERVITACEEAMDLLFELNREFDRIERRYNMLIDQKRIFAKRAAARIRYVLVEGGVEEDRTKVLVKLLNSSQKKDEILEALSQKYGFTERFQNVKENSFARPRESKKREFEPQMIEKPAQTTNDLNDFIVKPLYSHKELREFRKRNEVDGVFKVTSKTVSNVEELEKLLFVWQEATEISGKAVDIEIGEEVTTKEGLKYSEFSIRRK